MLSPSVQIGRLLLAALLGGLIGLERERLQWVAGLRTHMLVCVGSALIMIVSAFGFMDALAMGHEHIEVDVARVAAQVVSGIGFLGAGTILLRREVIRGLTTAASLWAVAAIGLAVGGGLYLSAITATVICLGILVMLKPIERFLATQRRQIVPLAMHINTKITSQATVEAALAKGGLVVHDVESKGMPVDNHQELRILLRTSAPSSTPMAIRYLSSLPGVESVSATGTNKPEPN